MLDLTGMYVVFRLQYSEKDMAYKVFGIANDSTFVSSFMKKAEGASGNPNKRNKNPKQNGDLTKTKGEKFCPPTDLSVEWRPNTRGLFSLVFNYRRANLRNRDVRSYLTSTCF